MIVKVIFLYMMPCERSMDVSDVMSAQVKENVFVRYCFLRLLRLYSD